LEKIKSNINELKQKKITENFISKNTLLQDVTKENNDNINTHNHDTFKNKNNNKNNNNKTINNNNNDIKNGNNHLPIKNTTTVKVVNNAFDKKANTQKAYNKEEIMSIVNKNENNEVDSSDYSLSRHKSLSSSKQSIPHQLNQEQYNHMIEENCENLEEILEMKKNLSFTYFNSFNISDNELFNTETKYYFDKRYLNYMEHIFFRQYEKTEKR